MLSKSKIFFKGIVAVLPHMLSVIPFGIITGAIGVELGFDPILVYATSLIIFRLMLSRSSLFIPGFLGTPAVIIITSEFLISL